MKKFLKVLGIIIGVVILVLVVLIVIQLIKTHKALNDPRLADNYYESIPTGGDLETKYVGKGSLAVEHIAVKSDNKSIKNIYIYYPVELKDSEKNYPLVMVVNGSQTPTKTYLPYFERLLHGNLSWSEMTIHSPEPVKQHL